MATEQLMVTVTMSLAALSWLATGERGISSETLWGVMVGLPLWGRHGMGHPHDPDDFIRCENLLRAVPEFRPRLSEMSTVSPEWGILVRNWNHIVMALEGEVPGAFDGRHGWAPKTQELMRSGREVEERESNAAPL